MMSYHETGPGKYKIKFRFKTNYGLHAVLKIWCTYGTCREITWQTYIQAIIHFGTFACIFPSAAWMIRICVRCCILAVPTQQVGCHFSQSLINLVITGSAVANVWDNEKDFGALRKCSLKFTDHGVLKWS